MKLVVGMRFTFGTKTDITYAVKVVKVNGNDLVVKGSNGIISHISAEWLGYCLSKGYCEFAY